MSAVKKIFRIFQVAFRMSYLVSGLSTVQPYNHMGEIMTKCWCNVVVQYKYSEYLVLARVEIGFVAGCEPLILSHKISDNIMRTPKTGI
jgi:hypothetical protein